MGRSPGTVVVGRYELVRLAGRGGMGEVWEALDLQTRRSVAVKWLLVDDEASPALVTRFQREIRVTAEISSRHIVGIHDAGRDDGGQLFMVMDLLHGEDIATLARRLGPLPIALAVRIAAQTCEGLAIAHAAGVIHRDIKPGNLFLARGADADTRVVKILDFGIARVRPRRDDGADDGPTSITRTGMLIGSPAYMAPEQLRGARELDHRADVWALGVVLYRLLAGVVPHAAHEDSLPELMFAICGTPAPPLRDRAPWVPVGLADLVHHALQIAIDDRPASVRAFADGLAPWLDDSATITDAMLIPRPPEPVVRHDTTPEPPTRTEPAPAVTAAPTVGPVVVHFGPVRAPPRAQRPVVRWTLVLLLVVVIVGALIARRLVGQLRELRDTPDDSVPMVVEAPRSNVVSIRLSRAFVNTEGARWFADAQNHCTASEAIGYLLDHPPKLSKDGTAFSVACLAMAGDLDRARIAIESVTRDDRGYVAWPTYDVAYAISRADRYDPRLGPMYRLVLDYWPDEAKLYYYTGQAEYVQRDRRAGDHLRAFIARYPNRDGFTTAAEHMLAEIAAPTPTCHGIATDPDNFGVPSLACKH